MIYQCGSTLSTLIRDYRFKEVVEEAKDDRLTFEDAVEVISTSQLFSLFKGDKLLGFYSLDELDSGIEIHVYMFSDCRRYSLSCLRLIYDTYDTSILTSVYGTHSHVKDFLLKLGFVIIDVEENALIKNGQVHNLWVLKLTKE
ncbi:MAG: hypothetical protein ACRC6V_07010 [Bacteroidales bacterium]